MDQIFGRKSGVGSSSQDAADDAPIEKDNQQTSSVSVSDYFAQRRKQLGLADASGTANQGGGAGAGFTLDDQASFAERQRGAAYSGRRGLGAKSGGSGYESDDAPAGGFTAPATYGNSRPPPAAAPTHSASKASKGDRRAEKAAAKAAKKEAKKAAKKEAKKAAKKEEKRLAKEAAKGGAPSPTGVEVDKKVKDKEAKREAKKRKREAGS